MKIIAAIQLSNNGIGYDNDLLYRISDDIKYFRTTTMNNIVVMGYNTYKSFGNKPLSNRVNIVLTSKADNEITCNKPEVICDINDISLNKESLTFIHSKDDVLHLKKKFNSKIFIIGGESIYRLFLDDCDRLLLTIIHGNKEADTFFPDYHNSFRLSKCIPHDYKTETDDIHYSFNIFKRK